MKKQRRISSLSMHPISETSLQTHLCSAQVMTVGGSVWDELGYHKTRPTKENLHPPLFMNPFMQLKGCKDAEGNTFTFPTYDPRFSMQATISTYIPVFGGHCALVEGELEVDEFTKRLDLVDFDS